MGECHGRVSSQVPREKEGAGGPSAREGPDVSTLILWEGDPLKVYFCMKPAWEATCSTHSQKAWQPGSEARFLLSRQTSTGFLCVQLYLEPRSMPSDYSLLVFVPTLSLNLCFSNHTFSKVLSFPPLYLNLLVYSQCILISTNWANHSLFG